MRVYQFRHIRAERQCSEAFSRPSHPGRTIFGLKRGLFICGLLGLAFAHPARAEPVEVVVTMAQPSLAEVFAHDRSLAFSSFVRPRRLLLSAPSSRAYLRRLASAQLSLQRQIRAAIPAAVVRWRYGVVLNGFAVVVPRGRLERLSRVRGVDCVWPNVRYHALLTKTPELIGATTLWDPALATAGQGMKIAIVDDGIDQSHPFFSPQGYSYPPGFPKGQTRFTTPKVIAARAFAPRTPRYANARLPFDPRLSSHATHVAGIAAGNHGTVASGGLRLSGIAPRAYLGNYKALTIPSQFGPNGNAPELAAAIEAAVRDGMDVINFSIGEVEIEPTRDLVVRALDAAADAGVVSAVAAGNDFEFGLGSISSPANAQKAISVAASTGGHGSDTADGPTSYSSAGPTPYSLRFKPDLTAPGDDVVSATSGGFGDSSGTSMAAPHVAGAAALLRQRHPDWTPANVKSALVLTGVPVRTAAGVELSPLREGGGRIDLVRADRPLVFAAPTSLSFGLITPGSRRAQAVALSDAGGGAGEWAVQVAPRPDGLVSVPAQTSVPGSLRVEVAVPQEAAERDVTGFIVLSRGSDRRRFPFWFRIDRPLPGLSRRTPLVRPGQYRGNTARGTAAVASYRYPDVPSTGAPFPVRLPGREVVYRVQLRRRVANVGVAVLGRDRGVRVEPRIIRAGNENLLAGYTALPLDLNPYRTLYGRHRLVSAVVLPAPGLYDVVFDTPPGARAGGFRFRFWVGDATPPVARVLGIRGRSLDVAVRDRGSGVDPESVQARVDGRVMSVTYAGGRARIALAGLRRGRHVLTFSVADYQETKNMENVSRILPNTRTLRYAFLLR